MNEVFERLRGGVIVSAQAMNPASPLADPEPLVLLARASELGGAAGYRVDGSDVVARLRPSTTRPIIAIAKRSGADRDVYITPTVDDARPLLEAGADIVAADATSRRSSSESAFAEIVELCHRRGRLVLADVATMAEAKQAVEDGADAVATTLVGFTSETQGAPRPAVDLAADLVGVVNVPVLVEGGIWEPEQVRAAFAARAWAVVVGAAVTAPDLITARLVAAARRSDQGRADQLADD